MNFILNTHVLLLRTYEQMNYLCLSSTPLVKVALSISVNIFLASYEEQSIRFI